MDALFRPNIEPKCEMCSVCGRGVGMVFDDRRLTNPHPFMCLVCELRFPPEQWEADEQGVFFNLSKNGGVDVEPTKNGGKLHPYLKKD